MLEFAIVAIYGSSECLHPIMKKGMSRLQFIYLEIIANQLPLPIINEKFILLYVAPLYEEGKKM